MVGGRQRRMITIAFLAMVVAAIAVGVLIDTANVERLLGRSGRDPVGEASSPDAVDGADADAELADAELADAELADAELADAELADAERANGGRADGADSAPYRALLSEPERPALDTTIAGSATLDDILVPSTGALFGSTGDPQRGLSSEDQLRELEATVGRQFDIYHRYHAWQEPFPDDGQRRMADEGRILYVAWNSTGRNWDEIAAGRYDTDIVAQANLVAEFGQKMFVTFHHEPEDEIGTRGTAADYVAAARHVHDIFESRGATNAIWVWQIMGWDGHRDSYDALYPGNAYVDWIGYDHFNWYGCHETGKWRSPQSVIGGWIYDWARHNHPSKPLMLAEFGIEEQKPGDPTKADWFDQVLPVMLSHPDVKAFVYFDNGAPDYCDWPVDTSPESLAAFSRLVKAPYLNAITHETPPAVGR